MKVKVSSKRIQLWHVCNWKALFPCGIDFTPCLGLGFSAPSEALFDLACICRELSRSQVLIAVPGMPGATVQQAGASL